MDTIECIKSRRSVREYDSNAVIDINTIYEIISIASWSPSGKNLQPWNVKVVTDNQCRKRISKMIPRHEWIAGSSASIVVFLDKNRSYDRIKDVQGCGAFMQTVLLAAHSMNIDSCWVGGVLRESDELNSLLEVPNDYELMGLITLGIGIGKNRVSKRLDISDLLL